MPDIRDFQAQVDNRLWTADPRDLRRWKRWGVGLLRLIYVVGRDIADGQISLRAMSLVYTTLLSLVPLLAISFSVLKGFGVHNQIEPLLMRLLAPLGDQGEEIARQIIGFVDNIRVGVLGAVGLGLLVYTVISLMQKIENAFNFVWRVPTDRSMGRRFTGYLSVLLIGPLLVFSSLGMTAAMTASPFMQTLVSIQPFGWMVALAGKILPYVMVVFAFAFMYLYMPNTRVRVASAFTGALVSGLLWVTLGWIFTTFVVASASYTAIYSAFATLILFMMWVYMSWLVLLVGALVGFYHQHPECIIPVRSRDIHLSPRMREKVALLAMTLIGRRFYDRGPAWTAEELATHMRIPVIALDSVLLSLERNGFIHRTGEHPRYAPHRPLENTSVGEVLETIRASMEMRPYLSVDWLPNDPAVDGLVDDLTRARAAAVGKLTMKELVLRDSISNVKRLPMLLADPPPLTAPRSEWEDYLRAMRTLKDPSPEALEAIDRAEQHLARSA
jgi:membrane protein